MGDVEYEEYGSMISVITEQCIQKKLITISQKSSSSSKALLL